MDSPVKTYDAIVIGTGSGLGLVNGIIEDNPDAKIAVIDKDEPGGICLTRGCIPSKILVYCADLVRIIGTAGKFGIETEIIHVDFPAIMDRMRSMVKSDVESIREGLTTVPNIEYFPSAAEFVAPSTLAVSGTIITAPKIFLCTGSRPAIPPVEGLDTAGYLTSDTVLGLTKLPPSIAIIGGGYIAAEYGHFFSAMGSEVTIIGRNSRFLHEEEPEISFVAERELGQWATILTGHEVRRVEISPANGKILTAVNHADGSSVGINADEILVATGRVPNSDILHPEKSGISLDDKGWIIVNERMETSVAGIWAFGDTDGKYLFKHVANQEAVVAFFNAVLGEKKTADYRAVPHAVFMNPEIAAVGMSEETAIKQFGEKNVLIGFHEYEQTAKGSAMDTRNAFAKIILEASTGRLLGAHIIGPEASILIQEVINELNSGHPSVSAITRAMHIHPALTEVVQAACRTVMSIEHYHHALEELGYLPKKSVS